MSAIVALMAIGSLLSGCISGPIARAPAGDPIDAARALSDAPDPVRTSPAKKSCGAFVLSQGDTLPTKAVQCMDAAASAADAAQLAWSSPTTEGGPIVSFAFVAEGSGEVTAYSTNAFDSYGGDPQWTTATCTNVTQAISLPGCPTASP
jgi:hypothetical protein